MRLFDNFIPFWKARSERRALEKRLQKIVSPEIVSAILNGDATSHEPNFREFQLEYVLAIVAGSTSAQISENTGKVFEIGIQHKAMIFGIINSLVAMTIGKAPFPQNAGDRFAFIADLQKQLGSEIKIIHGSSPGHIGLIGSLDNMASFTFLIPRFGKILASFRDLPFGEAREILGHP
jgi:hypothetical protein